MKSLRQLVNDMETPEKAEPSNEMTEDEYLFFAKHSPWEIFTKEGKPLEMTEEGIIASFTIPWDTYEENVDAISQMAQKGYLNYGESSGDYPNKAIIDLLPKGYKELRKMAEKHRMGMKA